MKNYPSKPGLAAVSILCAVILAACSSNSTPTLRFITISPQSATIAVTTTQQFTATAFYSDGTQKDGTGLVSWTSSDSAVATINASGVATGVAPGTVTITGNAAGTSGATATLTVNQPFTSIAVSCSPASVPLGATSNCTATGNPGAVDVTMQATWSSSDPTKATIPSSASTSPVVAQSVAQGSTNISATLNGISSNNFGLTVTQVGPVSLTISPSAPTVQVGGALNFTAQEVWSDGTTHAPAGTLTWSSSDPTKVSILSTGVAAAIATGSMTITVKETGLTDGTTAVTVVTGVTNFAYISNGGDSTIGWYQVSAGSATPLGASAQVTTPPLFANSLPPTQTVVHPNGNFLYVTDINSNLHVMPIDKTTGAPGAEIGTGLVAGETNINYAIIDPYGRFIYVSDDFGNTIFGFTIDPTTGALTQIGTTPVATATDNLDQPAQIVIDKTGTYMYVTNFNGNTVSSYQIDQTTGALTALTTIATGLGPVYEALDPLGTHLFVVDTGDNDVHVYTIGIGGALTAGTPLTISAATSLSNVVVAPSGNAIYITDQGPSLTGPGVVYAYSLSGGTIGAAIGSPLPTGGGPIGIAIDATGVLLAIDNNFDNTISLYTIATDGSLTAKSPATIATGSQPVYVTFYNAPAAPTAAKKGTTAK